ncbi:MAG TPA: xylose isomerase, partial [Bacteroidia bacterium]|nr:xylose isomerase [Bacteroidia bacterium]
MEISHNLHLTYCSNIHSGESWEEVFDSLKKNIPAIKKSISPDKSFGIGLRLSAEAAEVLLTENHLPEFRNWLSENGCYVFTMNGFPFGSFHNAVVKDEVYKPDWSTRLRMEYTLDLINVMA